jgi:hypothetical protein
MNAVDRATDNVHQNGSTASLLSGIVRDAQRLLSQQIELLKLEIKDELRKLVMGVAFIAVSAGMLCLGGLLLAFTVVYLLDWAFPALGLWVCFLIVGGGLTLLGVSLLFAAIKKFSSFHPIPDQSLKGLKENLQWKTNLR